MIVLNLELKGIYGFDDFKINFTYPKKIVHSLIEEEHLKDRPRFRYKKAVILMGANASGKTALAKAFHDIFKYMQEGTVEQLYKMCSEDKGYFSIDFVNDENYLLKRLNCHIDKKNKQVEFEFFISPIEFNDFYEKCVSHLEDMSKEYNLGFYSAKTLIGDIHYHISTPMTLVDNTFEGVDKKVLLKCLKAVIGSLDPTCKNIKISKDLKNSYIIKRKNNEFIIQDGQLLNKNVLSSGTEEGVAVALLLAKMISTDTDFFYCDEHFSYTHSELEQTLFGIMMSCLKGHRQLIFTTHNTDMLDLNLPKHTYMFLTKQKEANNYIVRAISANEIIKRNTDSVRTAVENDMFHSLPDEGLLLDLAEEVENE